MDEEDNENPSEINSYFELVGHRLSPKPLSILEENQEVEYLITHNVLEIVGTQAVSYGSDPESAKDSNSFVGDSDSAMSVRGEAKFETEVSKLWHCSGPSSSSLNWVCNSSGDPQCPLDNSAATDSSGKDQLASIAGEHASYHHYIKLHQNLDEAIVNFESPSDDSCCEHVIDGIEPYPDKELDDILYSNTVNLNMYILSSGRWSVNQDAQPGARKPTIDQEFEQYFSTLML